MQKQLSKQILQAVRQQKKDNQNQDDSDSETDFQQQNSQKDTVLKIFEDDDLQTELFTQRCHDIGESMNIEKAKVFKEEYLRMNPNQNSTALNLNSMRLGVNSIVALSGSKTFQARKIKTLNLGDNSISDYGMHAIKNIISNQELAIQHLNLSSNMISEAGLEMIVDELIKNNTLKSIDFGVLEGSIRKNSIGIDGAKCIAAILLHNRCLEGLKLQDNDIGISGGEIIGAALKQNKFIKHLKISENELKTEGAEYIIKNSENLQHLNLGKNYINQKIGPVLKKFMESSKKLQKLNLEYNELLAGGVDFIAQALPNAKNLIYLNLKGNAIRDEGLEQLSSALLNANFLEQLDISVNEITPIGISSFADILPQTRIEVLNMSKNLLGDDALIFIADALNKYFEMVKLKKIDFSSSRVGDAGLIYFLEKTEQIYSIQNIKANNNFISEKIEKLMLDLLVKNKHLIKFALTGNRLSICCLNRVNKILNRNQKEKEDKEPNKLQIQLFKMKHDQQKNQQAKENIDQLRQVFQIFIVLSVLLKGCYQKNC